MKYMILIVVLFSCIQHGGCSNTELYSIDVWSVFLEKPTFENLDKLTSQISDQVEKCDWGRKENYIAVPPEIRQELFDKIISASEASLRVGLYVIRCFDGGDLGDFRRSAGLYFEKKPQSFLLEIINSSVTIESYKLTVSMLPLALVDNIDGQVKATRHRILLLKEIEGTDFSVLKSAGIEVLTELEQSLNNDSNGQP